MLQECMEVFRENEKKYSMQWFWDNHIPKDGVYILINTQNGSVIGAPIRIRMDKRTGNIQGQECSQYELISFMDFYSNVTYSNKCLDVPQKMVHSNNMYTFFIKGKSLDEGVSDIKIEKYYKAFERLDKTKKDKELYKQIENQFGQIDIKKAKEIENWTKLYLKKFSEQKEIKIGKDEYLKLFFIDDDVEQSKENIKKEGLRYIALNVFNKNDYNQQVGNKIIGVPNANIVLGSKKPLLENKTRKITVPYLIEISEAIKQMYFFDYLSGQARKGKNNIYIDLDEKKVVACGDSEQIPMIETGIYLRIQTGKELEIHYMDRITGYKPDLDRLFIFECVLKPLDENQKEFELKYGGKTNLWKIEELVDDIFFSKQLKCNYFKQTNKINIEDNFLKQQVIKYREHFFNWFKLGNANNIATVTQMLALRFIVKSIAQGNRWKAMHQLNLWISIMDYFSKDRRYNNTMSKTREMLKNHIDEKEDWDFENVEEYCYAVGQLMNTYLKLSKSANKNLSFINRLLLTKNDKTVKQTLLLYFKKYNYAIKDTNHRIKTLHGHIMQYDMDGKEINGYYISAGFVDDNLIYAKKEKLSDERGMDNE